MLRLLRKDGFGDSVFICYAILPLYDMNEKTGATSIAPGPARRAVVLKFGRAEVR